MTIDASLSSSVSPPTYHRLRVYRRLNSKLSELLSTTVAGEPTADDEEGRHSNEKQEALVKEQEEEGRWLLRPGRYGRHDQGR